MNSAWIYAALLLAFASKNAYSQAPVDDEAANRSDPRHLTHVEHPPPSFGFNHPPFPNRGGQNPPPPQRTGNPPPDHPISVPNIPSQENRNAPLPPQGKGPNPVSPTVPGNNGPAPPPPRGGIHTPPRNPAPPVVAPPTTPNNPRNPLTPQTPKPNEPQSGRCRRIVRQEIKDLSPADRQKYWNAIKGIMRRSNGPSPYDLLTKDHDDYNPLNHGTPLFLVWHRIFIRKFELSLQRVDSSVAAHYWEWSADAQAPELSVIFTSSWYGGNGDYRRGNCIRDGQFSSFQPYYRSSSPCLTRKFNAGNNRIGSFVAPEVLSRYIANSRTYDSFRLAIEGQPHAAVHNGIGSGFSTMKSPNDPIFWLHHTFVDKLYMDWQLQNPRRFREVNGRNTNENTIMRPWNERAVVGASSEIYGGCITYAAPVNAFRGGRPQRGSVVRGNPDGDDDDEGEQSTRANEWMEPNRGSRPPNGHFRGNRWGEPSGPIRIIRGPGNPGRGNRGPIRFFPRPIRRGRWQRRQLEEPSDLSEEDQTELPEDNTTNPSEVDSSNFSEDESSHVSKDDSRINNVSSPSGNNPINLSTNSTTSVEDDNSTLTDNTSANNTTLLEVVADPSPEDVPKLCYDKAGVETPCPDDRENILDLRAPVPIPDEYLRMNNQNVTYIRMQEADNRKLVEKLNNLEGYVSPCALLNREDFLVKLAKKGTEFKQVVKGKLVKVHLNKKDRKSPHSFVENLKKQFTRIGYNVVKSYDTIQTGIHRILGSGTEYMYRHFHGQKGSVYYEDDDEEEYCEDE